MPGARRTHSLACESEKARRVSHHRYNAINRHSLRDGFNSFLRALPGDRALLPPSSRRSSPANLTPASGRQDHTTSSSALAAFVSRSHRVHRIPHPTFVTIAKRPSCKRRTPESVELICPTAQANFFTRGDWTTQITLYRLNKLRFARTRFPKPEGHASETNPREMIQLICPDGHLVAV
jgi:hypothetical protein